MTVKYDSADIEHEKTKSKIVIYYQIHARNFQLFIFSDR